MSDEEISQPALPQAKDVIASIQANEKTAPSKTSKGEKNYLHEYAQIALRNEIEYVHLTGIKDHYKHKGKWSWFLMGAIGVMIAFQSVLLWKVGTGYLNFKDYNWLLPALLVQNLGQVVGLAVYAVKYLFSDIRGNGKN